MEGFGLTTDSASDQSYREKLVRDWIPAIIRAAGREAAGAACASGSSGASHGLRAIAPRVHWAIGRVGAQTSTTAGHLCRARKVQA